MKERKVKTSLLIFGILVELTFAIFIGFTAGARGLGSLFPQLNLVAKPFVCPDRPMSYTQHQTQIGSDTYWSPTWFCGAEQSGAKSELAANSVFLFASPVYILVFFAALLIITYVYWNSSIGPAKNDGLYLW
jgi:hypothetical protein